MDGMIFWGATGQAKVLRECMRDSGLRLVALFDNNPALRSPFPDTPLYTGRSGFEDWMEKAPSRSVGFLVAIGGDRGRERLEIQEYLESHGLVPLVARHRSAFVADDVRVGGGSQVLAAAAVCVDAVLGRGCIINTGATVDHECRLDDGVHVAPGAHLAGCVEVGAYAMIGAGAVVSPRIKIGQDALVGAGAVVVKDVPPDTVVVGNPARVLRRRRPAR
jgi:sugar O-acyltransferase (sialic acid O-acetyltransferase NeuD family)